MTANGRQLGTHVLWKAMEALAAKVDAMAAKIEARDERDVAPEKPTFQGIPLEFTPLEVLPEPQAANIEDEKLGAMSRQDAERLERDHVYHSQLVRPPDRPGLLVHVPLPKHSEEVVKVTVDWACDEESEVPASQQMNIALVNALNTLFESMLESAARQEGPGAIPGVVRLWNHAVKQANTRNNTAVTHMVADLPLR